MSTQQSFRADHAIVAGYGSIGARHAQILADLGLSVSLVSRREVEDFPRFANIGEAVQQHPDAYVVIANETAAHADTLRALQGCGHTGPVLVEKPLFAALPAAEDLALDDDARSRIFIGYNLRFHPLVLALRARLSGRQVHAVEAAVGQYLPQWRPQRDYREGYSASRAGGGGVLRDLSHEIDYMLWLFGPWERVAALAGRSGDLELDCEDYAYLLIRGRDFSAATLGLDYLDRNVRRALTVHHDQGTTRLDFIQGTLMENGEVVETAELERNDTFREQHLAILRGQGESACTYPEGIEVVRALEAAEQAVARDEWVML